MNPTERFSDRVENYVRYRPGYPEGVLEILRDEVGLTPTNVVADIGSGTGISSELFLRNGNRVFGVEPNGEMRRAAEALLAKYDRFESVPGSAEATALGNGIIDFVVAGQAFHWFDRQKAKQEFARILRPSGWVVLLWNTRRTDSTPFLRDYEALLQRYGTDYREILHTNIDALTLGRFFEGRFERRALYNEQRFDLEALTGRLLSSSYAPAPGHPNHEAMLSALERIFLAHEAEGEVCFEYDTELYWGRVG